MTAELTDKDNVEGEDSTDTQTYTFSGDPETNSDSKTVLIAGERDDNVGITNIVSRYDTDAIVPSELSIIRREERYYGPELLLHASIDGVDQNYLLIAPGPTEQLQLWAAQRTDKNSRDGWIAVAEVQAALSAEQPPYEICDQCGEEIRTIQHERMAVLGRCQRV